MNVNVYVRKSEDSCISKDRNPTMHSLKSSQQVHYLLNQARQLTIGNPNPVFIKIGSKDERNDAKACAEGRNPAVVPNMLHGRPTDGLERIGQGEVADESDNDSANNGGLGRGW